MQLDKLKADAVQSGVNKVTADGNDGSANTNGAKTQVQAAVKNMLEELKKEFV